MSKKVFRIYNNSGFTRDVDPFGSPKIKGTLEDGEYFHNKELDSIVLKKDDYLAMINFEDSFEEFFIDVLCGSITLFKGKFNMLTAEICKDKCTITLKVKEDSIYECLKRNDEERNIIATPDLSKFTTTYNVVSGDLQVLGHNEWLLLSPAEQSEYGFLANAGALLFPVAWAKNLFTEPCINGYSLPAGATLVNDDCSGSGYFTYSTPYTGAVINANSGCGSPIVLDVGADPCNENRLNAGTTTFEIVIGNPIIYNVWIDRDFGITGASNTISDGYLLDDVFSYLSNESGCLTCYESDFFNDAENYVTGESENPLRYLSITEMSDIVYASGGTPATVLNLSLLELYAQLKEVFQLIYKVDPAGCFRVEHVSRAIESVIDINDIGEVLNDPCCYSVDRENIPRFESWTWNEANSIDFKESNIEYKDSNGNYYINNDKELKHDASTVSTDIDYIYDAFPELDNLDGIVLLANSFDGTSYNVINETGYISGNNIANGHLSQANLINKYWRDNRYLPVGNINTRHTAFNSVKPYKNNDSIRIRVCCDSLTNGLNFDCTEIKTDCGQGIIESYEFDLITDILTITPIFR